MLRAHRKWKLDSVLPAALAAWASMVLTGTVAWGLDLAARGHHSADEPVSELMILFVAITAVPFAFAVLAVYTPIVMLAQRWVARTPAQLAAIGIATAPVAGLSLLAAGHWLFRDASGQRRVMSELDVLMRDPLAAVPWLLALVIGGAVFGVVSSWTPRSLSGAV